MMPPSELEPLVDCLTAVQHVLDHFSQQGVVIGGVAASLLGKPRTTADVDAMILLSADDLPELIRVAAKEGLTPRIHDAEAFARRNRVLLLHHQGSNVSVDISLGLLTFEVQVVERSNIYQAGNLVLRLPTPEDLIVLKAIPHRPKDLQDIQAVIHRYPQLDKKYVRRWLKEFAEALEAPEIFDDIMKLLK